MLRFEVVTTIFFFVTSLLLIDVITMQRTQNRILIGNHDNDVKKAETDKIHVETPKNTIVMNKSTKDENKQTQDFKAMLPTMLDVKYDLRRNCTDRLCSDNYVRTDGKETNVENPKPSNEYNELLKNTPLPANLNIYQKTNRDDSRVLSNSSAERFESRHKRHFGCDAIRSRSLCPWRIVTVTNTTLLPWRYQKAVCVSGYTTMENSIIECQPMYITKTFRIRSCVPSNGVTCKETINVSAGCFAAFPCIVPANAG